MAESEPAVVITGTGRSGSGYIARVLNEAGVNCGHEDWWNPHEADRHTEGLDADSSWCALALGLGRYEGTVLHQIRHPLDVVSSLVKQPPHSPYFELQAKLIEWRMLWVPSNWEELAMATWLVYVHEAESLAVDQWRLEDLGARKVVEIAGRCGVTVGVDEAEAALQAAPSDINWHGEGPRYEWGQLPSGTLRDQLFREAARLGYR